MSVSKGGFMSEPKIKYKYAGKEILISGKAPKLATEFNCLGSDCPDTCCTGWNISLDKSTHKKYLNCADQNIQRISKKALKRRKGSEATTQNFSTISLNDNGQCVFLDGDSLCKVQKSLGEKFLSKTCNSFPRMVYRATDTEKEIFLGISLACPASAKICVSDNSAQDLVSLSEDELMNYFVSNKYPLVNVKSSLPTNFNSAVRSSVVNIVSDRHFTVFSKYLALDMFFKRLNAVIKDDQIIKSYIDILKVCQEVKDQLKIQTDIEMSENVLLFKLEHLVATAAVGNITNRSSVHKFYLYFKEAITLLNFDPSNINASIDKYKKAQDRFSDFYQSIPYAESNYLVNECSRHYYENPKIESYLVKLDEIFLRWAIVKFLASALTLKKEKMNLDTFSTILSSTSRTFDHNVNNSKVIVQKLTEKVGDKTAGFGLLLA